jgi:polyadenylate-binding protein
MNGYNLNDRVLYVTRFENKIERLSKLKKIYEERKQEYLRKYQNSNLFIKNLDDQIDDARLSKEFSKFGAIKSVKVMLDEKKQSKGFGFVCFENNESAKAAFDEMNGRILLTKPLFVAIAQRKEERKKILAAKFKQRMQTNQQIIPFSTNNNYYVNTLGQFQNYASISVPRWQNKANINQRNIYSSQQTADYFRVQTQQQYFVHSKTNNHNQIIQKQPYVGLG